MPYDSDLGFIFQYPTQIIFGVDTVKDVALQVEALGGTRALVVTDRELVKTDLVERVTSILGDACAGVFSDVIPDTGVHIVEQGAEYGREVGADVVVSVGGGSAIDTAKGITVLLKEGGCLADYAGINNLTRPQTPHIVIPTTAGTGSEVTYAAVIKDHKEKRKMLLVDTYIYPQVAILDPAMTAGMPPGLTAATGMDALTHAIESIHSMQREPIADALALHAIRMIVENLPKCVEDGSDLTARGQQLIAANIAGVAFSNAQVGVVHALAHSVGARYGVPHGVANSILLPHGILFNLETCPDRYAMVAEAMGVDVRGMDELEAGQAAAEAAKNLAERVGLPLRLRDAGVPEDGFSDIAELSLEDGAIVYNPRMVFEAEDLEGILKEAW